MHEFAIGQELVSAVLTEMERITPPPARLTRVRVVVGALRQVIPDYLRFAFETLTRDTPAAGAEVEITLVPVTATCRACGWQGEIVEHLFLCEACGSSNLATDGGMELYLDGLEVEVP